MVSEDSDHLVSGYFSVHGLCDLGDLRQALAGQVAVCRDQFQACCELREVGSLRSAQFMLTEEWNDYVQQLWAPMDCVRVHVFPVVVVSRVHVYTANSEECLQPMKCFQASSSLWHHKVVVDLEARSVALPMWPVRLPREANGEAPFSVNETDDPADCDQSFLLIAWLLRLRNTAKIVTAHLVEIGEYLRMLQVFQHLVGFL
jgi:hypothetical protein